MRCPIDLVILAGGRSSRMGEDKLTLRRNGRLLITTWLEAIAWPSEPLIVLPFGATAPAGFGDFRIAHDAVADEGPLRGVLTAMQHRLTDWQLIVPVDMPNLRRSHLHWLCDRVMSDDSGKLGMCRRLIGKNCVIEPFPLLLHSDMQSTLEKRLLATHRSLHGLADDPCASVYDIPKDWSDSVWLNLNRKEDLQQFLAE